MAATVSFVASLMNFAVKFDEHIYALKIFFILITPIPFPLCHR